MHTKICNEYVCPKNQDRMGKIVYRDLFAFVFYPGFAVGIQKSMQ